jgi:hypothetical protein
MVSPCWASHFSLLAQRKVTKRKGTPDGLPFGFPRHSSLPTGRPESPSGLHWTKSGVLAGFTLPKPNTSASLKGAPGRKILKTNPPFKLAEDSCAGRVDWPGTTRWQRRWLRGCEARAPGGGILLVTFLLLLTNLPGANLHERSEPEGWSTGMCSITKSNSPNRAKPYEKSHEENNLGFRSNTFTTR